MESTFRITSGAITDRGLSDKRPQNEDSYLEMGQCGIYAVADGVGGAQAGDVASQMAVEILGEAFTNRRDDEDPEFVMRTAIGRANSAIHQMAHELPQLSNMATTIVALYVAGNIATIGHVGDSRLYRVDRESNLFAETDDHSMVAEEVRAGRMTHEQAENHPGRNIINRALGAESAVEIDLKTMMVEPGSAFLLCSDGITRHVSDQEIKGVLTFGGEPAEVCEFLKELCFERGAEDNLTAVVVKIASDQAGQVLESPEDGDSEVPTIASTRPAFNEASFPTINDEDDEILELETMELSFPDATTLEIPDEDAAEAKLITAEQTEASLDQVAVEQAVTVEPLPESVLPQPREDAPLSIFESSTSNYNAENPAGSITRLAAALGMLILGSLIGLGVYHFALAPKNVDTADERLSVMKTDDIAFSSFEKLRRNVDADPAAYIKEIPPADDAEDYYLIGRAYLLVGDFPKARLALIEAQKQLAKAEPSNARVLNADIATALTITNDPTLQNRFKQEIEANTKLLLNTANSNTSP